MFLAAGTLVMGVVLHGSSFEGGIYIELVAFALSGDTIRIQVKSER